MFDRAAFAFLAVLFLATSCTKRNPDYCDAELPCAEPNRPVCLIEEGDDSGLCVAATCSRSADCSAESPICDGSCRGCQSDIECMALDATAPMCAEGKCVQCITAADCTSPAASACIANQCRACTEHDQCESGVCNAEGGTCVAEEEIVYVDPVGSDTLDCGSRDMPCETIERGLEVVSEQRTFVRLAPKTYEESLALYSIGKVHLVGPGATLSGGDEALTLQVLANTDITLDGVSVSSSSGDGILCAADGGVPVVRLIHAQIFNNQGRGIEATECTLDIRESVLEGNGGAGVWGSAVTLTLLRSRVRQNLGSGVSIAGGNIEIVNNVIAQNGDRGDGGLWIREGSAGRAVHNSIYDNQRIDATAASAVQCDAGASFALVNNIVWDNSIVGGYVGGNCSWSHSIVEGGVDGEENLVADPRWVDPGGGDFHLQPGSPAVDRGLAGLEVIDDIDGDPRPGGEAPDIGADEAAM